MFKSENVIKMYFNVSLTTLLISFCNLLNGLSLKFDGIYFLFLSDIRTVFFKFLKMFYSIIDIKFRYFSFFYLKP